MDDEKRARFRTALETLASDIRAAEAATSDDRAPVELDQQSVGRLSRMDAMQVQAMALATSRRRAAQLKRILAASRRLEEGDFGYCMGCGEEIAAKRLELDPAVALCVDCASGR